MLIETQVVRSKPELVKEVQAPSVTKAVIYRNVDVIQGWSREQYFAFMATGMLINAIVEMFFMPNCAHFSELIRTGNLDFALLKPIDTQFLISFEKLDLGSFCQLVLPACLMASAITTTAS